MKSSLILLLAVVAGVLLLAEVAQALPAETPDDTPMVDGPVRAIDQVGQNVWVGGNFSRVERRNGALVDTVTNVAVFDSGTGQYKDLAPRLSGNVRDIDVYGTNVVIAGKFSGPSSSLKNLVVLDGTTGQVIRWYNAPALQSVLAAPSMGKIYGGGVSLSAFDFSSVRPLWTRAKTTVDPDLRTHKTTAGYRDLELDGSTIWAACACDAVDGRPAKTLVKLDTGGTRDLSWITDAGVQSFGISLAQDADKLYLGAGGSDFLAAYPKGGDGARAWIRDTSGSAQVVEVMGNGLVVGGHFWEVADQTGDRCGFRSSNNAATLDPFGECQTRHGLAAYSFSGTLDANWDPTYAGKYNLVWALHPDDLVPGRLHTGGDFTRVNGVAQAFYARLS